MFLIKAIRLTNTMMSLPMVIYLYIIYYSRITVIITTKTNKVQSWPSREAYLEDWAKCDIIIVSLKLNKVHSA